MFNMYDGIPHAEYAIKGPSETGFDDPRDFKTIEAGAALYEIERTHR